MLFLKKQDSWRLYRKHIKSSVYMNTLMQDPHKYCHHVTVTMIASYLVEEFHAFLTL